MYRNVRQATNDVIAMVEDGILTWEQVARAALCFMSEDDVADMAHANEFFLEEETEDPEEADADPGSMDGDFDSAMTSAGFGTDEDYGFAGDEY